MADAAQAEVALGTPAVVTPRRDRAPRGQAPSPRQMKMERRGPDRKRGATLRRAVDGVGLIRAVRAATANLEAHVGEVDALNVFPVPDGDTGSNMLATIRAALAEAERLPAPRRDLQEVAAALSRGALTGARGNSGVILSQIILGMTHGTLGHRRADGRHLATGLRRGSDVAYRAVLDPVEGTILTVIRDAADAAEQAAVGLRQVEAVLTQVIAAAADSVQRTPRLLPVLEAAGVVDSGGQGLLRLLEGLLRVDIAESAAPADTGSALTGSTRPVGTPIHGQATAVATVPPLPGHGYETEFIVSATDSAIDLDALRATIGVVGTSVIVAGDDRVARVHVHGPRPDLALAAGLRCGRLSDVSVRDLDEDVRHPAGAAMRDGHGPDAAASPSSAPLTIPASAATTAALVAVTDARGLADVLESLGAHVLRPAHGARPSVGEIVDAITRTGRDRVIVLPDDGDAVLAARQAAGMMPHVAVAVIPTRNDAEGIAAALAFGAEAPFDEVVARMSTEAAALRSFTVSAAARHAIVDGVTVAEGTLMALDPQRRLLAHGAGLGDVATAAIANMGEFDLVTCYLGLDVDDEVASALRRHIESQGGGVEVEILRGGQPHDLLLVAVE